MKSLNDIKEDMSTLYDLVFKKDMEVKTAAELSNIAGKNLKAYQLDLAERMFMHGLGKHGQQALPSNGSAVIEHEGNEGTPALHS
jgi:tyrosine-protein phosphatase YwqE